MRLEFLGLVEVGDGLGVLLAFAVEISAVDVPFGTLRGEPNGGVQIGDCLRVRTALVTPCKNKGAVKIDLGVFGIEPDGFVEVGDGFVVLTLAQ